ncbi:MAG TPA: TIGR04141 family sporadically distributed protein, partial [Streptosporangiaceae bacterium]|nr:TIGR04141 family sporadically distributed protein [Streptosporangiaceae bacterium]
DLLAPGDELVHVKRAHGSAPLSHLFSQGLVAAEALLHSPDVRARFAAEVRERGKDRTVAEDFTPKKIVFAILLKDGEQLTPETLFPFSRVTLAHTARTLERRGMDVEVIGINAILG